MRFCQLASGSRGNSTLVEANGTRILIDAGLSARGLVTRLGVIGMEPESIDAIVVSHEHADHVRGLNVWCKRFGTPVFITPGTHKAISLSLESFVNVNHFRAGRYLETGAIRINSFAVSHDAIDPVGFIIEAKGSRMGIVTDLGCATGLVRERLQEMDALVIESNHDPRMLIDGPYPWNVKDRIRHNHGHLSNEQSAELLAELAHPGLKAVALAHLSEANNLPNLALNAAKSAVMGKSNAAVTLGCQSRPGKLIEF